MNDTLFRTLCIGAAAALGLAPYWPQIRSAAGVAAKAVRGHVGSVAKWAAIGLLVAAAYGWTPRLPALPMIAPTVPALTVEKPSDAMQQVVAPIADAMRAAPMGDRLLWSQLWSKAAVVVAGDAITTEVVLTDTKSLRAFTVLALDIGWRRIGGNQPGKYAGLRDAIEAAFANVVGKDVVPVTPELRKQFAELCRAIAWAALPPRG